MIASAEAGAWLQQLQVPLAERRGPAPVELVRSLGNAPWLGGFGCHPVSAEVPPEFERDVGKAIAELPDVVKRLLEPRLLGVYFARSLGASAVTDVVAGDDDRILGAVVVIDCDAFMHSTANAWATWKENTPFRGESPLSLELLIAADQENTRKAAIQYLLLHEFGHVLTLGTAILPEWWLASEDWQASESYSFLPLAWQIGDDQQIVPQPGNDFPLRQAVAYYTGAQLARDQLPAIYNALEATSFPTLYAATNAHDDFAESFATYVHTILMQKRYELRICHQGIPVMQPAAYWGDCRSVDRHLFFSHFFAEA